MAAALFSCLTCLFGLAVGALGMAAFVLLTAARADAGDERADLLTVLVEKFNIPPATAQAICEEGESTWAKWRAKTRPLLWRWGYDWPEYRETVRQEFQDFYERDLPEFQPEPDSATITPPPELSDDTPDYLGGLPILSETSATDPEPTPDSGENL